MAWITIDDTKIDYPVVHTNNNRYYLNHDFKKEYSMAGGIFVDYRNDITKDDYSVVYGHNLSGKKMFGYLNMFDDKSFFDAHKTGKIYFEKETHDFDVIAYGVIDNSAESVYEIEKYRNNTGELVSYLEPKVKYIRDKKEEKYILLSTCYSDMTKRVVLLVGYDD